jgi:hypothetical protein
MPMKLITIGILTLSGLQAAYLAGEETPFN